MCRPQRRRVDDVLPGFDGIEAELQEYSFAAVLRCWHPCRLAVAGELDQSTR